MPIFTVKENDGSIFDTNIAVQTQKQNVINRENNNQKQRFDLLMVLCTVLLFYLAFPSGGVGDLTWVVLVPVIFALHNNTGRNAFFLGLLAATLGWMCSIWWAVNGIAEITSSPVNLVIPLVFVFCLLSALPYAIACWVHVRFKLGYSVLGALGSAVIFTVLVNYIPHILPGNLAHALYQRPLFIQLADIGGVPLVFFIVHYVNILLANSITLTHKSKRQSIICALLALCVFLGNIGYGQFRLQHADIEEQAGEKEIRIAMVQPNIDIKNRTRTHWQQQQTKLLTMLSSLEQEQSIDLVVFPEVPIPVSYRYFIDDKDFFDKHLPEKPLLLTAIKPEDGDKQSNYFNTMELIEGKQVTQEYTKQVLLPFGEYIPFEKSLPWLKELFPYAPHYKPGNQTELLTLQVKENVINILPLICYEAVFSDIVALGVDKGGELLINSSNDDWFGNLAGKKTHYALSLFRAVEFRKYLVRATNTGLSGIITPFGHLLDSSIIEDNTVDYSINTLHIKPLDSFYAEYPNLIKYCFVVCSLLILLFGRKANAKY